MIAVIGIIYCIVTVMLFASFGPMIGGIFIAITVAVGLSALVEAKD